MKWLEWKNSQSSKLDPYSVLQVHCFNQLGNIDSLGYQASILSQSIKDSTIVAKELSRMIVLNNTTSIQYHHTASGWKNKNNFTITKVIPKYYISSYGLPIAT